MGQPPVRVGFLDFGAAPDRAANFTDRGLLPPVVWQSVVTDNFALQPSDFNSFSVVAPVDPRLPGGGGDTVTGLYNVTPDKFQRDR